MVLVHHTHTEPHAVERYRHQFQHGTIRETRVYSSSLMYQVAVNEIEVEW